MSGVDHSHLIRGHYEEMWGPATLTLRLEKGLTGELPIEFHVLAFPPSKTHRHWTYATSGMSTAYEDRGLELHMVTPERNDTIVELLTAVAHYHRTGQKLDHGHTVNFGRPWLPGSHATHGLLSRPYLDGPLLEWLPINDRRIRFLWLLPLTESEVEFNKRMGLEVLEQKLEQSGFNYLNPLRTSVV